MDRSTCQHRGCKNNVCKPRGLCKKHYDDRAVRELYPPARAASAISPYVENEQTAEELDRIEREQREILPAWWDHSSARMEGVERA